MSALASFVSGRRTKWFIFLVALGVDYTIFLTSAGVILAGTFAVLMALPVTFAFNIGFMVAVGILLDTFVVRTIMVPAAGDLLGDRVWWPSTARGGGHALREHAEPDEEPVPA